jgi:dual 3',5'-cyclic-AMP and -GMP phosphodiesterase 11
MIHRNAPTETRYASGTSLTLPTEGSVEARMLAAAPDIFSKLNMAELARAFCRTVPGLVAGQECALYLKHCRHNTLMKFTLEGSSEVDFDGIPMEVFSTGNTCHVAAAIPALAVPIHAKGNGKGELVGVLEVRGRDNGAGEFAAEDVLTLERLVPWCSLAIKNAQTFEQVLIEARWANVLLGLARNMFENLDSKDAVVTRIMTNAAALLKCEKCSVFMVDFETNELYARLFDMSEGTLAEQASVAPEEIRFPMHAGIAGHVATTGEVLNIPDAYEDGRFNQAVDMQTGFKTQSILCMPILAAAGKIIGVAQLVNKTGGTFTSVDELLFDAFAVFCGLSIEAVSMFEATQVAASRHAVVLEVLSYQVRAPLLDTEELCHAPVPTSSALGLQSLDLDLSTLSEQQTFLSMIRIFADQDFMNQFRVPYRTLCRWIITVRKNYRDVTYHNWKHAFGVSQMMFAMISEADLQNILTPIERLALVVGCLCHDLDHRGTNNSFEGLKQSGLSKLYETSTMERHHFDMCVMILNCDENNILANVTVEDYKTLLQLIEKLILATDITMYLKNRKAYQDLIENGTFEWTNSSHRIMFMSMLMTASDLSAVARPWQAAPPPSSSPSPSAPCTPVQR